MEGISRGEGLLRKQPEYRAQNTRIQVIFREKPQRLTGRQMFHLLVQPLACCVVTAAAAASVGPLSAGPCSSAAAVPLCDCVETAVAQRCGRSCTSVWGQGVAQSQSACELKTAAERAPAQVNVRACGAAAAVAARWAEAGETATACGPD